MRLLAHPHFAKRGVKRSAMGARESPVAPQLSKRAVAASHPPRAHL